LLGQHDGGYFGVGSRTARVDNQIDADCEKPVCLYFEDGRAKGTAGAMAHILPGQFDSQLHPVFLFFENLPLTR
jgi:hypothetical protein